MKNKQFTLEKETRESSTIEKSLGRVISEKEFISKVKGREKRFFALGNLLRERKDLSQKYYSNLESEAHSLETFLDNHRARGNKTFFFLAELVASVRWFARTIHTLKHIQIRYKSYGLKENQEFLKDLFDITEFCNSALSDIYDVLVEEALSLGIEVSSRPLGEEEFAEAKTEEYLVQNIDEIFCLPEEEKITEVAFKYVDAERKLTELLDQPLFTEDDIEESVSAFHRIQTKYDSYIKNSNEEKKDPRLKLLRGYISISLHLLEAALYLYHLYERHISTNRISETGKRLSDIISPPAVNDKAKVLLGWTKNYAQKGSFLAKDLLKDYADVTLARERILIPKGSILHLRPASALVEPVIQCRTPVLLEIDGKRVRANSVLEIIAVMGEVADKLEQQDVEMVLQGDEQVVKKMKDNFLSKILETKS